MQVDRTAHDRGIDEQPGPRERNAYRREDNWTEGGHGNPNEEEGATP